MSRATEAATPVSPPKSPRVGPVRLPLQERSKATWRRILEVSVEVMSELGFDGLTIGAVCERAGVAPTAIYSRVSGREGLLLAAYEFGMRQIDAAESELERMAHDRPNPRSAVMVLARIFDAAPGFLRATVLGSSFHPYIAEQGAKNIAVARERFILASVGNSATGARRDAAGLAFSLVFSAMLVRVAHGAEFTGSEMDDNFTQHMCDLVVGAIENAQ